MIITRTALATRAVRAGPRLASTGMRQAQFSTGARLSPLLAASGAQTDLRRLAFANRQLQLQLQQQQQQQRFISLSPSEALKNGADDPENVRRTPTLFKGRIYTAEDLQSVKTVRFQPENFGDKIAVAMIQLARWGFDIATRYRHPEKFPRIKKEQERIVSKPGYDPRQPTRPAGTTAAGKEAISEVPDAADSKSAGVASVAAGSTPSASGATGSSGGSSTAVTVSSSAAPEEMTLQEMRKRGIAMSPEQWLTRLVFLESIAGVPGLVAAACRHLQSLRLMRRDKSWIPALLEDAENERQHLLICCKLAEPGLFMRFSIIAAQFVYTTMFGIGYLLFPRVCHRAVGALEEEACLTYTNIINDVTSGRLPEWEDLPAPQIAKEYYKMAPDAKWLDVLYAIRADEAMHRHVNHTLGSLDQAKDFNPFAVIKPSAKMAGEVAGLTREQAREWAEWAEKEAEKQMQNPTTKHMASPSRDLKQQQPQQ